MADEVEKFINWLSTAKKGDQYAYVRNEIHMRMGCTGELARAVYDAYKTGHVMPVQRRVEKPRCEKALGRFDYIAIRTELDTL